MSRVGQVRIGHYVMRWLQWVRAGMEDVNYCTVRAG